MLAGYSNSGRTLLPPTPCPARRPDERRVVGDTDLNTLLLAVLGRRSAMSGRRVASFRPACAIVVSSAFVITRDTHPITMPRPRRKRAIEEARRSGNSELDIAAAGRQPVRSLRRTGFPRLRPSPDHGARPA